MIDSLERARREQSTLYVQRVLDVKTVNIGTSHNGWVMHDHNFTMVMSAHLEMFKSVEAFKAATAGIHGPNMYALIYRCDSIQTS